MVVQATAEGLIWGIGQRGRCPSPQVRSLFRNSASLPRLSWPRPSPFPPVPKGRLAHNCVPSQNNPLLTLFLPVVPFPPFSCRAAFPGTSSNPPVALTTAFPLPCLIFVSILVLSSGEATTCSCADCTLQIPKTVTRNVQSCGLRPSLCCSQPFYDWQPPGLLT